jgi:transketolase
MLSSAASANHEPAERLVRLQARARNIRRNVVHMAKGKGEGYVGQGLGAADMLAAIYFHELRFDARRLDDPTRDRFLLSTGHYSIVLYAALTEAGVYGKADLAGYGADEHPFGMSACDTSPGVEITGGSLAQGLSQAIGLALGARLQGRDSRVVNFLSDGELDEGATWEAAMAAAHYRLDNLLALVDVNGVQADGKVAGVMPKDPIGDKWRAFGWHVEELDGNSMPQLLGALDRARAVRGKPKVLVCTTTLGCGVPFLMQRDKGHFIQVGPEEWDRALAELEAHS